MQLGDAEPGQVLSRRRAPVLAMAGGSVDPFVLHFVCAHEDDPEDACDLTRTPLPDLAGKGENAVLVTAAGNFVVAVDRDAQALRTYGFDELGALTQANDLLRLGDGELPVELIASLRNSDWVVGLDANRRMVRFHPKSRSADLVAPELDDLSLTLATVGEQHIIGRVRKSGSTESLYLIAIDEEHADVHHAPTLLWDGRSATRIVVGPDDGFVAITIGHGDTADTLVFRIPDGSLIDRFSGEMVSGREDMTETPGLRAVSPDGTHLAYRSAEGSLALRDVTMGSACVVQSSEAMGAVRMAGFGADGTVFFESEASVGKTAVSAWDPTTRYLAVLATPEDDASLVAAPIRSNGKAWAMGARSGAYMALADSQTPERLDLDGAVFIPRDDPELWVLDNDDLDSGGRRIGMRRLMPRQTSDDALRFGTMEDAQHHTPEGGLQDFEVVLSGPQRACMSTGTPGARAYTCGSGSDARFFSGATAPKGEDPVRPPRSSEVPDLQKTSCEDGGVLLSSIDQDDCGYNVSGCCFATKDRACNSIGCGPDACQTVANGQIPTVTCGVGTGFPYP